jgi:TrwC relaxase
LIIQTLIRYGPLLLLDPGPPDDLGRRCEGMTIVSARSGYDPAYYSRDRGAERSAAGYYISPAQQGEAAGRWFGRGAEALGFRDGQEVAEDPYLKVYAQVDPRTGEKLGRAPGG